MITNETIDLKRLCAVWRKHGFNPPARMARMAATTRVVPEEVYTDLICEGTERKRIVAENIDFIENTTREFANETCTDFNELDAALIYALQDQHADIARIIQWFGVVKINALVQYAKENGYNTRHFVEKIRRAGGDYK